MYKHILRKGRFYIDWLRSSKYIFPLYEKYIKKKIGGNLNLLKVLKSNSIDLIVHHSLEWTL